MEALTVILGLLAGILLVQYFVSRRTNKVLGEAARRNSAILRVLPDLMFVLDRNGVFMDFHAKNPNDLYRPPEQFLGKNLRDVLPSDLADLFMRQIKSTGSDPTSLEYSLELHGENRFYEARMVELDAGRLLTIVREVTTSKRAEDGLDEARRFSERLVEPIPSVIFI